MTPRTLPAIVKLLDTGHVGHKRYFANHAKCDQRTAARLLCHLWMEGILYIKDWQRERGSPLPIYARRLNGEQDAPKPKPFTSAENKRRQLADPEKRVKINTQQKMYRMAQRAMSGNVRLGMWGL